MIGRIAILATVVFFALLGLSLQSADQVLAEAKRLEAAVAETRNTVRKATLEMRRSDRYFEDNDLPGLGLHSGSTSQMELLDKRILQSCSVLEQVHKELTQSPLTDPAVTQKLQKMDRQLGLLNQRVNQ